MYDLEMLKLTIHCPVKTQNAGLFVSRGYAMHPTRIIDSHELIFVKQGELDMWEGERTFHLESGQTLLLRPGRRHGSTKPMPPDLRFYWIHFEIDECRNEVDSHLSEEYHAPAIEVPSVVTLPQPERLERLFRVFLDEQESGVLHPYTANLLTVLMLAEIMHSLEQSIEPAELNPVATWANSYIRMNYDRPITPNKVAEALGYNADYLGRIYQKSYGCTLTEAIHHRRIRVASQYLLDSNLTIEQIASKCGFSDPDYFRRIFKRYMKISPSRYRDEFTRVHINTH